MVCISEECALVPSGSTSTPNNEECALTVWPHVQHSIVVDVCLLASLDG